MMKERMLLVLNTVFYGEITTPVARTIRKNRGWASQWLKRYREEGIEGLKDRPIYGRHSTFKGIRTGGVQDKDNLKE